MEEKDVKKAVREGYGKIALQNMSCCGPASSCCGGGGLVQEISRMVGYGEGDLTAVPEGANLGLGCGNPVALASLQTGEVVVDLGSGAGFDCFLAAPRVGKTGRVIGVDMTAAMIDKARENARKAGYDQVEFRLGEIENLPVADGQADIIISNCVINLSPDKARVFREAFRILKPGGRLMVSDIVLLKPLPEAVKTSLAAYIGCVAGAVTQGEYLEAMQAAGFQEITILEAVKPPKELWANDPTTQNLFSQLELTLEETVDLAHSVYSMKIAAIKPLEV